MTRSEAIKTAAEAATMAKTFLPEAVELHQRLAELQDYLRPHCERCGRGEEEKTLCPNCQVGTMRRFGQDTFYFYFKCETCGKERLVSKSDITTSGREYRHAL